MEKRIKSRIVEITSTFELFRCNVILLGFFFKLAHASTAEHLLPLTMATGSTLSARYSVLIPPEEVTLGVKVAEGGFGEVLVGTWEGRKVAVKRLLLKHLGRNLQQVCANPGPCDGAKQLVGRPTGILLSGKDFAREVGVWSRLQHSNVLQLYGVWLDPPMMVAPFMDNGNVVEYVYRNPNYNAIRLVSHADHMKGTRSVFFLFCNCNLTFFLIYSFFLSFFSPQTPVHHEMYGIILGIQFLHSRRIVHTDLKGFNVLVDPNGEPLITDFGFAEIRQITTDSGTAKLNPLTPRWCPPERLDGRGGVNEAGDIYAFAMVCYEVSLSKSLRASGPRHTKAISFNFTDYLWRHVPLLRVPRKPSPLQSDMRRGPASNNRPPPHPETGKGPHPLLLAPRPQITTQCFCHCGCSAAMDVSLLWRSRTL